jgi:hypothetical protein
MNKLTIVNFGSGYPGLTTVGYAIYSMSGSLISDFTTSGVFEVGVNTGIYAVNIGAVDGIIIWRTSSVNPRYGVQESLTQLNSIQNETDTIRLIWNSMRNQGEAVNTLLEINKENKKRNVKSDEILVKLKDKEYPSLKDIKDALHIVLPEIKVPEPVVNLPAPVVNLPAPIVNIPETIIPDYSKQIEEVKELLSVLQVEVNSIPKKQIDYSNNFENVKSDLDLVYSKFNNTLNNIIKDLVEKLNTLESQISENPKKTDIKGILDRIAGLNGSLKSGNKELAGLIGNVDRELITKVKIGYDEAVKEKRNILSANRRAKTQSNIKLGLGIK